MTWARVPAILLAGVGLVLGGVGTTDLIVAGVVPVDVVLATVGLSCVILAFAAGGNTQLKVLLMGASFVLSVAAAETALRWTRAYDRMSGEYLPDVTPTLHHSYRPGDSFVRRPGAFDEFAPVSNEIDSVGIRGPERRLDADVLLIGDSFIQADEIEYSQTIGQVLEQTLRRHNARAVVVSHGMGSWSPLLEWNWYLKVGRQFSARVVFLFIFSNDFDPDYPMSDPHYLEQTAFGPDGRPDHFVTGDTRSAAHRWLRRFDTVKVARLSWQRLSARGLTAPDNGRPGAVGGESVMDTATAQRQARQQLGHVRLLSSSQIERLLTLDEKAFEAELTALDVREKGLWRLARPERLWSETLRAAVAKSRPILTRFSEDVGKDGGRLVLVYVPLPYQVGARECSVGRYFSGIDDKAMLPARTGVQEWLGDVAGQLGLAFLDPTDAMRTYSAAGQGSPLYTRYDCHWSAAGHRLMASLLGDWLSASAK